MWISGFGLGKLWTTFPHLLQPCELSWRVYVRVCLRPCMRGLEMSVGAHAHMYHVTNILFFFILCTSTSNRRKKRHRINRIKQRQHNCSIGFLMITYYAYTLLHPHTSRTVVLRCDISCSPNLQVWTATLHTTRLSIYVDLLPRILLSTILPPNT